MNIKFNFKFEYYPEKLTAHYVHPLMILKINFPRIHGKLVLRLKTRNLCNG